MPPRDALEAFKAQGLPQEPVGALDELKAHNLPTRVFPACCEPSNDESVKGCPHWYDCTMSYRGLDAKDGGGPRNHAWERIKPAEAGGGITRNVQACFWGVGQQEVVTLNKEILRVIGDEGDTFEVLETRPDQTAGKNNDGFLKWDTKLYTQTVQPFVRLGQEQKLAKHELRASIIQREKDRLKDERPAKALGVSGGDTPLDKRHRGGLEAPKKKD